VVDRGNNKEFLIVKPGQKMTGNLTEEGIVKAE
jgi:hypothetical protein